MLCNWGHLTKGESAGCLALGWGRMYNHATPANLRYFAFAEERELHCFADRDIEINEELTINYNGDWNDEATVWFDLA